MVEAQSNKSNYNLNIKSTILPNKEQKNMPGSYLFPVLIAFY